LRFWNPNHYDLTAQVRFHRVIYKILRNYRVIGGYGNRAYNTLFTEVQLFIS